MKTLCSANTHNTLPMMGLVEIDHRADYLALDDADADDPMSAGGYDDYHHLDHLQEREEARFLRGSISRKQSRSRVEVRYQ